MHNRMTAAAVACLAALALAALQTRVREVRAQVWRPLFLPY